LIDYFHDMSLLRNTIDNSIDFLRASCTLDGCIKIWTSRVDSVGTETGKLLSNLANERASGDNDDEDGDGSENGDSPEDSSQPRKHKKSHRSESTLAKPEQIAKKEIELDFNVDPLFRKTCADFDEGGAQGLLMNHLGINIDDGGGIRVIFDASDSVAKSVDDDQESEEPEQEIDIGNLHRESCMLQIKI
jgi:condensin complex subunit 2